jgi:hypothetical protein
MPNSSLTIRINEEQLHLKEKLQQLQVTLESIEYKIHAFEAVLKAHLTDVIIAEQELTVLYKQQKARKKLKRLGQKKKLKGRESNVLTVIDKKLLDSPHQESENKLRKKLYREAMLQVHPDKFSLLEEKQDLTTQMTSKLIELYTTGSLAELTAYHGYIFNNQELSERDLGKAATRDTYLLNEIDKLKQKLSEVKARQTYHVLMTYAEPMNFLSELQIYYQDRLFKLRKRTRVK